MKLRSSLPTSHQNRLLKQTFFLTKTLCKCKMGYIAIRIIGLCNTTIPMASRYVNGGSCKGSNDPEIYKIHHFDVKQSIFWPVRPKTTQYATMLPSSSSCPNWQYNQEHKVTNKKSINEKMYAIALNLSLIFWLIWDHMTWIKILCFFIYMFWLLHCNAISDYRRVC